MAENLKTSDSLGDASPKKQDTKPITSGSTLQLSSAEVPEASYAWNKFKPSLFLSCFNLALQLVLLGGGGSFLFGFCIAGLNTATKTINSAFLQCGRDGDVWARFNGVPEATCSKFRECAAECKIDAAKKAVCNGGYNQKYGFYTIAQCALDPLCDKNCGVKKLVNGKSTIVDVRCHGGYNDIGCNSLGWYNAFLTTAILIGATVGSLTGSRLLALGRRSILLVTMCIFLVGTICCTVANSFSALVWGRLIVGYAVGLVSVASPTYMSEVTPKHLRGSYGVMHQLMIVVGIFLPMLLGLPLEDPSIQDDFWAPSGFQMFWWRFMVALAIAPALFVLYLLAFVYSFETPVYYVEQRRFKDAARLLELIHGKSDIKEELDGVIDSVRQGELNKEQGMSFTAALRYPEYRHVIIVGILLSAFQQFGGINVFVTSSSGIFEKAGLSGSMQTVMSIIMGIINIVMTFPTLFLIERMGRRSLMLMGSGFQFLAVCPAAIMYWVNKESHITQILAIVAVLGFVTFFALAYGPVLWVYLFEIYPMEIKDVAAGVATAANWVCGVIMVFVSSVLPNQIAFSIFAGMQLIGTLLIFFLMKETKGLPLGESPFITKKHQV